jgi:16S rRNA (guanine966-N2)-methyltransferase
MRIIAGAWRGRALAAPAGLSTRPTADRLRQALFDMLWHAPWGGREVLHRARVMDAFAGTGALGLEALSRGAAEAVFIENGGAALTALRGNIAACGAEARANVIAGDALNPPRGQPCSLVFLDPPYIRELTKVRELDVVREMGFRRNAQGQSLAGSSLVVPAVAALQAAGWIASGSLIVAETARDEKLALPAELLADRAHGAGRMTVWRQPE